MVNLPKNCSEEKQDLFRLGALSQKTEPQVNVIRHSRASTRYQKVLEDETMY